MPKALTWGMLRLCTLISILLFEPKGQLILKIKSNQKNKGTLYHFGRFYFDSLKLLFWFDLFLEKSGKKFVGFLEDVLTPKGQFEINWPIARAQQWKLAGFSGLN